MLKNEFTFRAYLHTVMGCGKSQELGGILKANGMKSTVFIIDSGVFNHEKVKSMVENTNKECDVLKVYESKAVEPTYDQLDEARSEIGDVNPNVVVGVGGGSTMDMAKGLAVLLRNPGKGLQYRGFNVAKNPSVPIVAIPTTSGTGSEVTPYAVFTDTKEQRKFGINSDYNYPKIAVLDPELTVSCPEKVTVSAGMDALVHTLESYGANKATPFSRVFAKAAFPLIFNVLPKLVDDQSNIELRSDVMLGSHYAGISLMNAGAGPAGAMSYPLGVLFKVPHGIAGAVFINEVIKTNVERGAFIYEELYDMIDGADASLEKEEKNRQFSKELDELCKKVNVPTKLSDYGVKKEDAEMLAEQTFNGLRAAIDMNPVKFEQSDLQKMIEGMF